MPFSFSTLFMSQNSTFLRASGSMLIGANDPNETIFSRTRSYFLSNYMTPFVSISLIFSFKVKHSFKGCEIIRWNRHYFASSILPSWFGLLEAGSSNLPCLSKVLKMSSMSSLKGHFVLFLFSSRLLGFDSFEESLKFECWRFLFCPLEQKEVEVWTF